MAVLAVLAVLAVMSLSAPRDVVVPLRRRLSVAVSSTGFDPGRNGTGGACVLRFTTGVGRVRRSFASSSRSREKDWDKKRGRAQVLGFWAVLAPMGGDSGRMVGAARSSSSSNK